uniref:DRBM domain-containing protein n=1 Tax=Oryza meridionalis TaxID=40149 RepID=A0A0E0F1Q0_9ORYZ
MDMPPTPLPPETTNISPAPNGATAGISMFLSLPSLSRLFFGLNKNQGRTVHSNELTAVVINNTSYDSLPGFFNRKAAEQSAAEVALMEIVKSIPANANIPAVQETGLCKNLLQEYAQKMNYAIPSYICTKSASGLAPFVCTVEIGGIQYIGAAARTKKDAEIKAARTALLAIQGQSEGSANGATKYIVVPGKRLVKEVEKRPIGTPKPLKVKKGGFKKKWNKRKFMKKDGQVIDVGKDEARVAGDAHDSDVLMQPTVIAQEASCGTPFLQPCEEAKRVEDEPPRDIEMVQPDKENQHRGAALVQPDDEARVEQEPSRDISVVQPNEDAISGKQEPSIDAAILQPKEEASSVKQEPFIDTAMLQACKEAGSVELGPARDTVISQLNEQDRGVKQEPAGDTAVPQPDVDARVVKESPRTEPNGEATNMKETPKNSAICNSPETKEFGDITAMGSDPPSTNMSEE